MYKILKDGSMIFGTPEEMQKYEELKKKKSYITYVRTKNRREK